MRSRRSFPYSLRHDDGPRGRREKREPVMHALEIRGRWNIISGITRQMWARLTRNEFQYTEGKFEEIAGRVQMVTGETYRRLKMPHGR
jgi:uncharacterized protein YjbJ (UPF0337 family)